jgi:hypothetical protein
MYATHAAVMLKEVINDSRITQFSKIPGECMRGMNHVSPELLLQLDIDSHVAKLALPSSYSDSGYDSGSTLRNRVLR